MTFGQAIEELKQGKKMRRSYWKENALELYIYIKNGMFIMRYLNFRNEEKLEFPPFRSSDYLAEDWEEYKDA